MPFDENKARYYAKPGCKKCGGKGFQSYTRPSFLDKVFTNTIYCPCSIKRMKNDQRERKTS